MLKINLNRGGLIMTIQLRKKMFLIYFYSLSFLLVVVLLRRKMEFHFTHHTKK